MEALHAPERLSGESFSDYKLRRSASQVEVARILAGTRIGRHAANNAQLRSEKRFAGGQRQWKRDRMADLRIQRDFARAALKAASS